MSPSGKLSIERRKDARVSVALPIFMIPAEAGEAQKMPGNSVDISASGFQCVTTTKFEIGQQLRVWFEVEGRDEELNGFAEVVWVRPSSQQDIQGSISYQIGLHFVKLSAGTPFAIGRLVEKKMKDLKSLQA